MGRAMALDIGDVRIGVAVSDLMKIIANPLETYTRTNTEKDFEYFAKLIKEKEVDILVVGLPLNMAGEETEQVLKNKAFVEELLTYVNVPVKYQDERLTSISAERVLIDADVTRKKRKTVIDKLAATIILESYLNCLK